MTKTKASSTTKKDWWLFDTEFNRLPLETSEILAPYELTSPGSELLSSVLFDETGPDWGFPSVDGKYSKVSYWTIWPEDEDKRDEEMKLIDDWQSELGPLEDEVRYLRLQIACFQRCRFEFEESGANLETVLNGIYQGEVDLDGQVSCEPPWSILVAILRHQRKHPAAATLPFSWKYLTPETNYDPLSAPRQKQVRAYLTILSWWRGWGDLSCLQSELPDYAELCRQVYRWLGEPTMLKVLQAEKLREALIGEAFPVRTAWGIDGSCRDNLISMYDEAIKEERGDSADNVSGRIGPIDMCHHGFFRHVDHQLTSIGQGKWVETFADSGKHRQRITSQITNYVHILGSWLMGRSEKETTDIWPESSPYVASVFSGLGDPTPVKRWLVASLRKKLSRNQRHHGGGALDADPDRFAVPHSVLGM